MSKESALAALKTLTEEEADILNNDPVLLGKFKRKHGLDVTEDKNTTKKSPLSMMFDPKIVNEVKMRSGYDTSPVGLLNLGYQKLQEGANRLGEKITEEMGRNQVNPKISAGLGTLISMSPDIISSVAQPIQGGTKNIPNMAIKAQRRALGYMVPDLKTPYARGQAASAAKIALEQGVTSASGNPNTLFNKANTLANKTGQGLSAIRESVGEQPLQPILDSIDNYKMKRLQGAEGPGWQAVSNKIEDAKNKIVGLVSKGVVKSQPAKMVDIGIVNEKGVPILKKIEAVSGYTPPVSLKRIADVKKEIADSVNWLADNVSQRDAKGLAVAIEKGIETSLQQAGGDIKTYKNLKPIYKAAKSMIKGLNREIAKQEGNNAISLPALVAGAGGGPYAALEIGLAEAAKRRGAGFAASELVSAANSLNKIIPIAIQSNSKIKSGDSSPIIMTKNLRNNYKNDIPNTDTNGNLENINNKAKPIAGINKIDQDAPPIKKIKKTITIEKAKEYLRKAKGNRDKARKMAIDDGWGISY